jgi:hypothetical protein
MKKFAIILALFLAAPIAQADILLEPYLGYYKGTSDDGSTKTDFNGVGFGGRVGYQKLGFMVGGEFMSAKWTDDDTPSNDITPTVLGVFVGYNFPVLLRVWGTYGISTKSKVDDGTTSIDLKGNSLKLGVGTTILPLVSINLEYMTSTFDEADGVSLATDIKQNTYGLSVSLPLTF